MGKLKDMFSTQIKEYGNYEKKLRWEKTKPKFINFDITLQKIKEVGIHEFDIVVTNILDLKDKRKIITKAKETNSKGMITKIICPDCGKELKLNTHWNAYICNGEHEKKIYEIKNIEYKRPKNIVHLENGW